MRIENVDTTNATLSHEGETFVIPLTAFRLAETDPTTIISPVINTQEGETIAAFSALSVAPVVQAMIAKVADKSTLAAVQSRVEARGGTWHLDTSGNLRDPANLHGHGPAPAALPEEEERQAVARVAQALAPENPAPPAPTVERVQPPPGVLALESPQPPIAK